jgi:hypothetical protein
MLRKKKKKSFFFDLIEFNALASGMKRINAGRLMQILCCLNYLSTRGGGNSFDLKWIKVYSLIKLHQLNSWKLLNYSLWILSCFKIIKFSLSRGVHKRGLLCSDCSQNDWFSSKVRTTGVWKEMIWKCYWFEGYT